MSSKRVNNVYTEEQRQQIIEEVKAVGNVPTVAKKHGISPNTIHTWIRKTRQHDSQTSTAASHEQQDIRRLKKQLSEKELENQILRDLLKKTYAVWKTD